MRTLFDKFVWNEFERPQDGPEGARAGIARVIPLSAKQSTPISGSLRTELEVIRFQIDRSYYWCYQSP